MLDSMSAWVLRYGEAAAAGEPAAAEALPAEAAPGLLTAGLPDVRAEPAETQVRLSEHLRQCGQRTSLPQAGLLAPFPSPTCVLVRARYDTERALHFAMLTR